MNATHRGSISRVLVLLLAQLHVGVLDPDGAISLVSSASAQDLLSANALYREFQDNPVDATARYAGRGVVLEGLRGEIIMSSDGVQAAVHIADGNRPNALILSFPDRSELRGIGRGQRFRFRCEVEEYKYSTLWMQDCSIEGAPSAGGDARHPGPLADASPTILSANALYRAFQDNEVDATRRHVGRTVTLEGRRGDLIVSEGPGAAVHIADRAKTNALILRFSDRRQLHGIDKGQRFRFTCKVAQYEYLIVWMEECSIVR
jgi:hypothetical protein